MLVPDRNGFMHDPLEVAEFLDSEADRSSEARREALHDAADVVRALAVSKSDADLTSMSSEQLATEVMRLRSGIRAQPESTPSPPATPDMPDHSTCRHCAEPITWDDYSYVHDATGFADCQIAFSGGKKRGNLLLDPDITVAEGPAKGKRAEPVEWDSE